MMTSKMEKALNEQINEELYSAYLYLAMSAWFESQNLPGFAAWMKVQAREENAHAMKFFDFLHERRGRVLLKAVKEPGKVDMVIFRENSEDIYAGIEWAEGTPEAKKVIDFLQKEMGVKKIRFPATSGIGIKPVSREGTERLVRKAIQYTIDNDRRSMTLVHKGNIQKFTEGAFRDWGYALAQREFGAKEVDGGPWCSFKNPKTGREIIVKDVITDAFLQQILLRPAEYDVIATLNLNGDYISDALAAQGRFAEAEPHFHAALKLKPITRFQDPAPQLRRIEKRLVRYQRKQWQLQHGPFEPEDFQGMGKSPWTVLVQGVNHALPSATALLEKFNFIPHSRLDDRNVAGVRVRGTRFAGASIWSIPGRKGHEQPHEPGDTGLALLLPAQALVPELDLRRSAGDGVLR